jgi:hypothetical protein
VKKGLINPLWFTVLNTILPQNYAPAGNHKSINCLPAAQTIIKNRGNTETEEKFIVFISFV